jgi:hypothetical protein
MDLVHRIIEERLEGVTGFCPMDKAHIMADLVVKHHIRNFIELGVYCGRSFFPVALAIKTLYSEMGEPTSILGIDAWEGSACEIGYGTSAEDMPHRNYWAGMINHENALAATVHLLRSLSLQDDAKLLKVKSVDYAAYVEDESVDMLHQDSNHSEYYSQREVELYHNKIKKGGWWIFDDTDWETTKKAQRLLESKGFVCREDYVGGESFSDQNADVIVN